MDYVVTRVHLYGEHCASYDRDFVSPVPKGMEPGSPFGASIQALATYYRYTHAGYWLDMKRRLQECLAIEPAQADGIRLKKRYLNLKDNLFLFPEDATIPTTNNSSEQAFRMSKVFTKVTNSDHIACSGIL